MLNPEHRLDRSIGSACGSIYVGGRPFGQPAEARGPNPVEGFFTNWTATNLTATEMPSSLAR